jgi:hypothetical protein
MFNMNHTILTLTFFSILVSILLSAIWSHTNVYAQQISSSSGGTSTLSSELKAKMCDPSNPDLRVINTTESRICGIAKTVKPPLVSSAVTPITSGVSSSSSPSTQQTTTTKSTTAATNTATPPKQQQVKTSNNNTNVILRPTAGLTGATIAPVSNASNKSLSSTSLSSAIAPQVKAINQQQQPPAPASMTLINSTAGQNDTFAAVPPVVTSDKLMYLGYHGVDSQPNNKSSSDTKQSSIHRSSSTASDDDSTGKKTSGSPREDKSSSSKPSGSTNDGGWSLSVLPELESAIKNKVDSIIKNTISSIKDNTPFLLPFP